MMKERNQPRETELGGRLAKWMDLSQAGKVGMVRKILETRPRGSFGPDSNVLEREIATAHIAWAIDDCVNAWDTNGKIPRDTAPTGSAPATLTELDEFLGRAVNQKEKNYSVISSPDGSIPKGVAESIQDAGIQRTALDKTVLAAIRTIHGMDFC